MPASRDIGTAADEVVASRRSALGGLAATFVCSLARPARAERIGPPFPVAEWLHERGQRPFPVPDGYIGLHSSHGLDGTTPVPAYPYAAIRSHDTDDRDGFPALQWARIERAPGRYDWKWVERWIAANPGRTRIFVLCGCPTFHQKYPGEPWRYPYLPGGGSPPSDPAAAARFVGALTDRFPGAIHFVEVWNEPNFGPGRGLTMGRWLPNMPEPGFFTGTAADLAQMARVVKRALPTGVGLMAGAWDSQARDGGGGNSLLRFARAPDGAGGVGRNHVDVLSVHAYTYRDDPNSMIEELRGYKKRFVEAGHPAGMAIHVTEIGAEAPGRWTDERPPLAEKVKIIKRWLLIPAALGFSSAYLYKHSVMPTLGDPARTPALSAAIAEIDNALRGRTVVEAARLADDSIWLAFSDGTVAHA